MKRKEEDKDLNHITEEAEQREVSGPEVCAPMSAKWL